MKLAFVAYDRTGKQVCDSVDAASVADAQDALRRRGLFVRQITGDQQTTGQERRKSFGRSGRLKNLAMFMRQLHVLVSSGTRMVESLAALERQTRDKAWKAAIADVRRQVEQGEAFSEALACHPECFDGVCRSLVAAGESSGNLGDMLDRLAIMARKQLHVRSAIIGALIYPALLMTVACTVMALLLVFVVPRFGELFLNLGVALPPTTQALVSISEFVTSFWWAVLAGVAAAVVGLRAWMTSQSGRRSIDTLVLRLPQFGRIVRSFAVARIARLLGVLTEGRVPVLAALELTRDSVTNYIYRDLMDRAHDAVTRGMSISTAFNDPSLVSPSVYESIHSGEQSGQVGPLLVNIADFLDEENETIVRSLTSIIEPVILIVMGLLVGLVAFSMFMPLFDLTAMTQGGAK